MENKDVFCKRCFVKYAEVDASKRPPNKLCPKCKEESLKKHREVLLNRNKSKEQRESASKNMSENNPMFQKDVREKVSKTTKKQFENGERKSRFQDPEKLKEILAKKGPMSEEARKDASNRMKEKNPMFDKKTRDRATKVFNDKIKSGDIVYKKGPEHHLWKGNRWLNDDCRNQLYPVWTRPILERDGFKCCKCQSERKLQVHHIKPLREFIAQAKIDLNLIDISAHDKGEKKWELIKYIVSLHKLSDGITVCSKCHAEIDRFYHENKKHKKK